MKQGRSCVEEAGCRNCRRRKGWRRESLRRVILVVRLEQVQGVEGMMVLKVGRRGMEVVGELDAWVGFVGFAIFVKRMSCLCLVSLEEIWGQVQEMVDDVWGRVQLPRLVKVL